MAAPGWQTDDLAEEWVEEEENAPQRSPSSSVSLTEALGSPNGSPNGSQRSRQSSLEEWPSEEAPQEEESVGEAPVQAGGGTFVVRDEAPVARIMPKTPGKGMGGFNMFTPLALEKMFDPPSPPPPRPQTSSSPKRSPSRSPRAAPRLARLSSPNTSKSLNLAAPSPLSKSHIPPPSLQLTSDTSNSGVTQETQPDSVLQLPSAQFTFTGPPRVTPSPAWVSSGALAQSTPGPSKPQALPGTVLPLPFQTPANGRKMLRQPATDGRLRLFQFQYDTYTREHLSALVDSIAVGTPDASSNISHGALSSRSMIAHGLSRVSETSDWDSMPRMRAAKRIKLSTPSEEISAISFGEGEGAHAVISRPQPNILQASRSPNVVPAVSRKDYVSESRSLMQQIKAARDFSTVSSVASAALPGRHTSIRSGARAPSPPSSLPTLSRGSSPLPPSSNATVTGGDSTNKRPNSAPNYRQKAQDLMAQIRRVSTPDSTGSFASTKDGSGSLKAAKLSQPSSGRASPVTSSGQGANSASIPGFVFTTRGATKAEPVMPAPHAAQVNHVGQTKAQRKRARMSTEADDVVSHELARRTAAMALNGPTTGKPKPASPPLGALPLPPVIAQILAPTPLWPAPNGTSSAQPFPAFAVPAQPARFPPGYPTASFRVRANQDMNRFVSTASTVTSTTSAVTATTTGTTNTAPSSIGSYVKHAGIPLPAVGEESIGGRSRHAFTHIGPTDVPVPSRVGRMVYDPVRMVWVKGGEEMSRVAEEGEDDGSEDPFRDIESLRDERSRSRHIAAQNIPSWQIVNPHDEDDTVRASPAPPMPPSPSPPEPVRAPVQAPMRVPVQAPPLVPAAPPLPSPIQEAPSFAYELDSFSLNESGIGIVPVMTGVEEDDFDRTTDTDDEANGDFLEMTATSSASFEPGSSGHFDAADPSSEAEPIVMRSPHRPRTAPPQLPPPQVSLPPVPAPLPQIQLTLPPTPLIKPAIKSASVTPISALKDRSRNRFGTPLSRVSTHQRRSVSFSDGRRDGPIAGVSRAVGVDETRDVTDDELDSNVLLGGLEPPPLPPQQNSSGVVPSARTRRIEEALENLGEQTFDTPSKISSTRSSLTEIQPLFNNDPVPAPLAGADSATPAPSSQRVFTRSNAAVFQRASAGGGNATFLTECSFGVAHDKLVTVITDVQPFEPYWESLSAIDLSNKKIDSVARLKEFLPKLDSLALNSNQLTYLSGIPGSLRYLSVASNLLSSMTSFNHLPNLETLDISRNNLDSLRQLECLRHLRELKADNNKITSLQGLEKMDGLVKLSLQSNRVSEADLSAFRWSRLETLNLSDNRITGIKGLVTLPALVALNLDQNLINELRPGGAMAKLRILRVSGNKLARLNVAPFSNLRTLYADNNALVALDKASRLCKLENLSLRNQTGKGLALSLREIRDVKRLYLSGNPIGAEFMQEACYNLIYLEMAACRLTTLPADMAQKVPNLRVLNLNYNFLDDVRPLAGLTRLRKLTMIGSRLKGTKPLIRCVKAMPDIEMLDFRMNPCTLGWYLPLLVRDAPGALQPSEGPDAPCDAEPGPRDVRKGGPLGAASWQELDAKFRRDLPDEAYVGRLAYRGLVMRACPNIRMLDGVEVGDKERDKAARLLTGILAKRGVVEIAGDNR